MILVFIENKTYLTKVLSYLDEANLPYTTDLEREHEILVVAENSNKVKALIQENVTKKIIFLTELEEPKLIKHMSKNTKSGKNYLLQIRRLFNQCDRIVVTMPSMLKLLKKRCKREIIVLPRELPIINISKSNKDIYEKYHLQKRSKRILIIDYHYEHLDYVHALAGTYPKEQFILLGYQPEYLMSHKNKDLYHTLPKNVVKQKYLDFNLYSDLSKVAWLVIYFYAGELSNCYLDITLLLKRQLLIEYHLYYQDYFVNSKNAYLFGSQEELLLRFKKLMEDRVANLTDNGYDLIAGNTHKKIIQKWAQIITF